MEIKKSNPRARFNDSGETTSYACNVIKYNLPAERDFCHEMSSVDKFCKIKKRSAGIDEYEVQC